MPAETWSTTELGDEARQGILTRLEELVSSELPLHRLDGEDIHGKNRRAFGASNWRTHDGRSVRVDVTITVGGMS